MSESKQWFIENRMAGLKGMTRLGEYCVCTCVCGNTLTTDDDVRASNWMIMHQECERP